MNYQGFYIVAHRYHFGSFYAIGWKIVDGIRCGVQCDGATPKRSIEALKDRIKSIDYEFPEISPAIRPEFT